MDNQERVQFETTLRQMGINPANIGTKTSLPPIPASDDSSLQRNVFDGFYQRRTREMWDQAEVTSNQVEDFKKCQHYLMKNNNEIQCVQCHIGWVVPETWYCENGKLYEQDQQLTFAI